MRITTMTTIPQQAATRQAEVQAELAAARAQAQADMAAERAAQAEARASEAAARADQATEVSEVRAGDVSVSSQGSRQVIRLGDGREIVINDGRVLMDGVPVSGMPGFDPNGGVAEMALQTGQRITLFVCMAIAFIVVGLPIARAFARWLDRRGSVAPGASDTAQRLAAIENAVESVAIEVERISEGQRFTARLLSERARDGVPVGADRVG